MNYSILVSQVAHEVNEGLWAMLQVESARLCLAIPFSVNLLQGQRNLRLIKTSHKLSPCVFWYSMEQQFLPIQNELVINLPGLLDYAVRETDRGHDNIYGLSLLGA